jgi:hypothetical protein
MGEGEHTIIGKIPRERLNQIASRKLSALGIPVRLGADRETLEGELSLGRVVHPATGEPLPRARFFVVGHDRLRFADPPLAALGPISFQDHERPVQLEAAVGAAVAERTAALQDVAARLRLFGLEAGLDGGRLAVRAIVKTSTHAFELLGDGEAVRVSRVAPVGGRPFDVAADFPPLPLAHFAGPADLERYLSGAVGRMRAEGRTGTPAPAAASLTTTPPPRNALTLAALARSFGEDAMLAPNAMVELVQEFQHGGTRYRFVATREMGTLFRGRLIGPAGDVWTDRFDLATFGGTRVAVARALGLAALAGAELAPGEAPAGDVEPRAGDVWAMNVVVEDRGDDVRYVGTDIDGRPYGAARVLPRADFEAVFSPHGGGYRLLVLLEQVQDGSVLYRQLDRERQPLGAPRKMSAAILVANFVPEAAAR